MSTSADGGVLLHLMRHGAPALAGTMLGRTDSPATAEGIAACVAQAADLEIDSIVASNLLRASACAEAIAAGRGLSLTRDPRWRELDFGAWDGLSPAALDPAALDRFWRDPDANPPPGGERWSSLVDRVAAAAGCLTAQALVVTHGGAMRASLATLCGFGFREAWAFDLPYASVLSLRVWRDPAPTARIVGLRA